MLLEKDLKDSEIYKDWVGDEDVIITTQRDEDTIIVFSRNKKGTEYYARRFWRAMNKNIYVSQDISATGADNMIKEIIRKWRGGGYEL